VYISFGQTTTESILNVSVATLRGVGEFGGAAYVVTDQPRCAPPTTTPLLVDLEGCRSMGTILYKYFKTKLLDVVPRRHRLLLYMDVDILVGGPIARVLAAVRPFANGEGKAHVVGIAERNHWHGGFAILRRDAHDPATTSAPCLEAWGREILKDHGNSDQVALRRAVESGSCVYAPLQGGLFGWPTGTSIRAREYSVLNHFTRTGRLRGHHGVTKADLDAVDIIPGGARPGWYAVRDDSCRARPHETWPVVYDLANASCARLGTGRKGG